MTNYGIVLTTISSEAEAKAIAKTLIAHQLAVCINFFPIHSVYIWQGEVCSGGEWQLIMKTDLAKFAQLQAQIEQSHPYDVPELIAIPITQGSEAYLSWMGATLYPQENLE